MKSKHAILKTSLLFLTLFIVGACKNYFMTTTRYIGTPESKASVTDSLARTNRYFILRNGTRAYSMKELVLNKNRTSIQVLLDSLPVEHTTYISKSSINDPTYKKSIPQEQAILNEVEFFIERDYDIPQNGRYILDLNKVQKIEIIEKDKKRTTSSYVLGAIGIAASVFVIATIIILATKSSCPFVSAYNGTEFTLQGEIYGGAIYPQLVRHDYLPLDMKPMPDGSLQLKISNELKEHQFTDITELLEITHNKNTVVYADEHGNLSAINAAVKPSSAWLNNKKDVTAYLEAPNDNALMYMNDTAANASNEVVLTFATPANAKNGKLLLNLKNSYFLDLLYGEVGRGFGTYYATYKEEQKKKTSAELLSWVKDQQIPLSVYAKTSNGWQKITDITTIGPVATRNIVIPLTLPESKQPITEIKLSSGFLFWEIDYAAMDFSEDHSFTVKHLLPVAATDEQNNNVLPQIAKEDGVYLSQPDIGNSATIVFKSSKPDGDLVHSYILHTKGYYEHIRSFDNKPNIAFLKALRKPNAFPLFGLQWYKKMNADQVKSMAKLN